MGLDQKIVRVNNTDLEKFYALNRGEIVAPHNPDLDQDYIDETRRHYLELQALYTDAAKNSNRNANVYRERMEELFAPYSESSIWYGRKDNHVHEWIISTHDFEETNLEYVLIDPEALLNDLKTVIDDPDKAHEVLPTRPGFFFGDTEYDGYYFQEVKVLHEVLVGERDKGYFENHSYFYWSWW